MLNYKQIESKLFDFSITFGKLPLKRGTLWLIKLILQHA